MSSEWIFRPSSKNLNEGLYFRYVQQECGKHGMSEHTEIRVEKKTKHDLPSIICRECCRDVEKRRAYKKQQQGNNSQSQKSQPRSFWND